MPNTTKSVPTNFILSIFSFKNICAENRIRINCKLPIGYTKLRSPSARAINHMARLTVTEINPAHIDGLLSRSFKKRN